MNSQQRWSRAVTTLRCLPALLAVATCGAVRAQSPSAAPVTPPSVVEETAQIAEQIGILKAIKPLQLTDGQVHALLAILKPGRQRLDQQQQANARQLAGVIPQLRQATLPSGAAPGQSTPAEMEYARVQQVDRQTREMIHTPLRTSLREALEKLLTPEQRAALTAAGRSSYLQQQLAQSSAGNRGSVETMARSLDQLRQADAARYASERQQFALRSAEVPNWWQFTQPGGPGGGNLQRGGRGRRGAVALVDPQQLQQQLNDPVVQARLRDYLALADQVRRMPMGTYQQQRSRLALQLWSAREERRLQTDPQRSIDAFIDQVLLAPAAVEVLEMKLKRGAAS